MHHNVLLVCLSVGSLSVFLAYGSMQAVNDLIHSKQTQWIFIIFTYHQNPIEDH